jgi:outer membrane protein assembly factor BamB
VAPGGLPGGARAGGPGGGGGFGGGPFVPGGDAAYVVGSDGYLHALNVQNGWENMTPALFIPANTRASGLIIASGSDGGGVAYTATTHGCGSQPDGVWAMDLSSPQKSVTAFQVKGASIAGSAGPAIGRDGTVYVATQDGAAPQANALFALEPKTLKLKTSAVVPKAAFSSSPVVIGVGDKDVIAAAGGGKVYLFDSASLASGPVATSAAYAAADSEAGALASWQDAQGTVWIAVAAPKGVTAMKVAQESGKVTLTPGWTSRDIASPQPPLVVNGVLFTASSGTRALPGVLYAIDAATGKDLWNSGKSITSTVRGGLSAGGGNVYVPGADGTLYAFGFAIEK